MCTPNRRSISPDAIHISPLSGFPFVELYYLAGSIEFTPNPLALTAASLEVQGRIVRTNISTALVSKTGAVQKYMDAQVCAVGTLYSCALERAGVRAAGCPVWLLRLHQQFQPRGWRGGGDAFLPCGQSHSGSLMQTSYVACSCDYMPVIA